MIECNTCTKDRTPWVWLTVYLPDDLDVLCVLDGKGREGALSNSLVSQNMVAILVYSVRMAMVKIANISETLSTFWSILTIAEIVLVHQIHQRVFSYLEEVIVSDRNPACVWLAWVQLEEKIVVVHLGSLSVCVITGKASAVVWLLGLAVVCNHYLCKLYKYIGICLLPAWRKWLHIFIGWRIF